MRKKIFGRQFKRDANERKSLFKGLISSLILRERIKTTEAKAKAVKSEVDKIITKAKKGETARNFLQHVVYQEALNKLIKEIAPRFEQRQGGYTRIIRFGERLSDKAKVVFMEWTEGPRELILNKDKAAAKIAKKDEKAQVSVGENRDLNKAETKAKQTKKKKDNK